MTCQVVHGAAGTPQTVSSAGFAFVERTVADGSFKMQAGEQAGEIAMMRPLETSQGLESGTFSVTMWGAASGADEPGDFAGFGVYGSGDSELFRWGGRQRWKRP